MKSSSTIAATFALGVAFCLEAAEWHTGGTLHDANLKEWLAATPSNRLATAADFYAATHTPRQVGSMENLKKQSAALKICIDEAATACRTTPKSCSLKIQEMAAACLTLMGE